jgi:hypothetical protein
MTPNKPATINRNCTFERIRSRSSEETILAKLRVLAKAFAVLTWPLRDMSLSILIPSLILLFSLINVNSLYVVFNSAISSTIHRPEAIIWNLPLSQSPGFDQGQLIPGGNAAYPSAYAGGDGFGFS